jgi:hypothetical protein
MRWAKKLLVVVAACASAYSPPPQCVQHDTEDVTIHIPADCDFDATVYAFCHANKVLNNTCAQIKDALEGQLAAGEAQDVPIKLIHGTEQEIDLWGNVKKIYFKPTDDPKKVANEVCQDNKLNEGVCQELRAGVVKKYEELWCSPAAPPEKPVKVQGSW